MACVYIFPDGKKLSVADMDDYLKSLPHETLAKYSPVVAALLGKSDNGIKFSKALTPETKNLVIIHNTSIDGLEHTNKLGGMPSPSIAIANKDFPLTGFGEISLIGSKENFAPNVAGKSNKTFNADIYSARYPRVVFLPNEKVIDKLNNSFFSDNALQLERYGEVISKSDLKYSRGIYDYLQDKAPVMYAYLESIGKAPSLIYEAPNGMTELPEINKILKKYVSKAQELKNEDSALTKKFIAEVKNAYAALRGNDNKRPFSDEQMDTIAISMIDTVNRYARTMNDKPKVDIYKTKSELSKLIDGDRNGYKKWIENTFYQIAKDEKLDAGETPSGNRKYIEHSIDNVLKIMKKGNVRNAENFNYGVGNVRAAVAKEYKKLVEIQKDRNKIVSGSDMKELAEVTKNEYGRISDSIRDDFSSWGLADDYITDVATNGFRWAEREYGVTLSDEKKADITNLFALLRDYPTEYFEIKPQRIVNLHEFSGAVVPNGAEYDKAIEILKKNGVTDIQRYDHGDEKARAEAVNKFSDLHFSKSPQQTTSSTVAQVKSWLPKRVQGMLDSGKLRVVQSVNDLPAHLRETGAAMLHTVWHGSPHDHNKFDMSKIGTGEGNAMYGYGHYFTDLKDIAEWYRNNLADSKNNGKLYEVELAPTQDQYLDWNVKPKATIVKKIIKSLNNNGYEVFAYGKTIRYKRDGNEYSIDLNDGQSLYNGVAEILEWNEKEASKFLHSIGIRGIRYKADQGKTTANNYVIFSDDDITITNKYSKLNGIQGLYDAETDKTYLVADMLNKDNANIVLSHELFHRFYATDPNAKTIMGKMMFGARESFDQASRGKGTKTELSAYQRVINAKTPEKDQIEEYLAYQISSFLENPKNVTPSLANLIKNWIASIRMALLRYGMDMGFVRSLTPRDLVALSQYGAKVDAIANPQGNSVLMKASKAGYEGSDTGEAFEWLRAVAKGLDMSFDARMARAKAMGFNTETPFYHGSFITFTEFLNEKLGMNTNAASARAAHFFASNPETASSPFYATPTFEMSNEYTAHRLGVNINDKFNEHDWTDKYKINGLDEELSKLLGTGKYSGKGQLEKLNEDFTKKATDKLTKLTVEAGIDGGINGLRNYDFSESSKNVFAFATYDQPINFYKKIRSYIENSDTGLVDDEILDFAKELVDMYKPIYDKAEILSDHLNSIQQSQKFNDQSFLEDYSESRFKDQDIAPQVYKVLLKTENLLEHDYLGNKYREESYADLLKQANNEGKNGIYLKSTYDGGKESTDIVALFDNTSIRSINAAFDPDFSDSPNILASFAGENAQTADKYQLATAKERLDNGEDKEVVRRDTGWFKGVDGKWRFEIDDSDVELNTEFKKRENMAFGDAYNELIPHRFGSLVTRMIINHEKLFEAYPFLKNIGITPISNAMSKADARTMIDPVTRAIQGIAVNSSLPVNKVISVILHELQHTIQNREDFSNGGTPSDFSEKSQLIELVKKESKLSDEVETSILARKYFSKRSLYFSFLNSMIEKHGKNYFTKWSDSEKNKKELLFNEWRGAANDWVLSKEYEDNESKIYQLRKNGDKTITPFDQYQRLAGEIEARNTQARLGLTAEQRRDTPIADTQDIPDSEAIVVWNGTEMASMSPPANADNGVRFSVASSAETGLPEETNAEKFQRKAQDKFNRFKVIQEHKEIELAKGNGYVGNNIFDARQFMKDNGIKNVIRDETNVYQAESINAGISTEKVKDFEENVMKPLVKEAAQAKIKMADISDFLLMRYALTKPELGISIAEANNALHHYQHRTDFAKLESIANKWQKQTAIAQREMTNAGMMPSSDLLPITIPKQRSGESDVDYNRRLIAEVKVQDMVTNIIHDYEKSINAIEKNKIAVTAANFIKEANDQSIGVLDPTSAPSDGKFTYYVGGVKHTAQFNDELLALAFKERGIEQLGAVLNMTRDFNNFLSRAYTAYSPTFLIKNPIRDAIQGMITNTSKFGMGVASDVFKAYPHAAKELYKHFRNHGSSAEVDRYRKAGGSTGAAYLSDAERLGSEIMDAYNEYAGAVDTYNRTYLAEINAGSSPKVAALKASFKAAKAGLNETPIIGHFLRFMENANSITENALRLATFTTLVNSGYSDSQAAAASKDLLNFNRKGELGSQVGSLYLFFNPSAQGTQVLFSALKSNEHKKQALALAGMIALSAFLIAETMRGGDDDDEEKWKMLPDNLKDRNFIFESGETKIMLPVPYGYGVFHSFGNAVSDVMHGASTYKASIRMAAAMFDNFSPFGNPIDSTHDAFQLLPTIPKMMMSPSVNENNFGSPIQPDKWSNAKPDSENMYRNTKGSIYATVARGLNEITGGSKYEQGKVSISPETLKFWTTTLTGGTGTFFADTFNLGSITAQGVTPSLKDIPIAKAFVHELSVQDARQAFWKNLKESQLATDEFSLAKKAHDRPAMMAIKNDHRDLIALAKVGNRYQKMAASTRDQIDRIRLDDSLTLQQKRDKQKALEAKEMAIYEKFLAIFDKGIS